MRAVGFHEPGEPDVLEVIDLPVPTPGPGELRIRVRAAAVNPTDVSRRRGKIPTGADAPPPPYVPGMDAAGVLEEIGASVDTELRVGEHVMAIVVPSGSHGAYSEQIVVPAESVTRVPVGATDVEASTLPMNGLTARLALDTLALDAGSVIAISGAAGAMGGYAVQLAQADGLTVVADASESDEHLVTGLGADVVLRRGEDFARLVRERFPEGVGGAIDGALLLDALAPAVRDGGTIVTVRGYDEPGERGITFQPIHVRDYARAHDKLDALRRLAEHGTVTLRVAGRLPKERADEAHRRLEAGGVRGRLVIEF